MGAHAAFKGFSCFAMPQIGVVDDQLEWSNIAIRLDLIFQDSYRTLKVNTLETEQDFYPTPSNPRENTSSELNHCAVVTAKEMLWTESVEKLISMTRSDIELAKKQRADAAIRINILTLQRYGVSLDDSHCFFGTNPISKKESLSWGTSKIQNSGLIGRISRHQTEFFFKQKTETY